MPRSARLVIPGLPHHITQRGNRRQPIFFSDADRAAYRDLIAHYCDKTGTRCLAWCLMDNHVHLILQPPDADALRKTLASAHTTYVQRINRDQQCDGHLFQGRFASYPMDEAHLWVAVRYVELNPVRAAMVRQAEQWRWSSAHAHVTGRNDGLTDIAAMAVHVANWAAMLARGLEAVDAVATETASIEDCLQRGLPMGSDEWRSAVAAAAGLTLERRRRAPQP